MDLARELGELLGRLEQARVGYALAGGLALAVHGVVRATADIDLLIPPGAEEEAVGVARQVGFQGPENLAFSSGVQLRRLVKFGGQEPLLLDLILATGDLETAWSSRIRVAFGDLPIWVVSREGLRRMQLLAAREVDLADLRRLEELDG